MTPDTRIWLLGTAVACGWFALGMLAGRLIWGG
jgi:hypothetical protein